MEPKPQTYFLIDREKETPIVSNSGRLIQLELVLDGIARNEPKVGQWVGLFKSIIEQSSKASLLRV